MEPLSPTIDLVFKLLLQRSPMLLLDMLNAVLEPPAPITEATVLNPELELTYPDDHGVVLDVGVRLADGSRVDVEMQVRAHAGLAERLVLYGARQLVSGFRRGDRYLDLRPSIVILWVAEPFLPGGPFHSSFLVRDEAGRSLSPVLGFHVLELAARRPWPAVQPPLQRWARFLQSRTHAEFAALAQEAPIMAEAHKTLTELSADELLRERALQREHQLDKAYFFQASLRREIEQAQQQLDQANQQRDQANQQREQAEQAARQGILTGMKAILAARGTPMAADVFARLATLPLPELQQLLEKVVRGDSLEA